MAKRNFLLESLFQGHSCTIRMNYQGGARSAHQLPPNSVQFFSFSCSFRLKFCRRLGCCSPPRENPGSATGLFSAVMFYIKYLLKYKPNVMFTLFGSFSVAESIETTAVLTLKLDVVNASQKSGSCFIAHFHSCTTFGFNVNFALGYIHTKRTSRRHRFRRNQIFCHFLFRPITGKFYFNMSKRIH